MRTIDVLAMKILPSFKAERIVSRTLSVRRRDTLIHSIVICAVNVKAKIVSATRIGDFEKFWDNGKETEGP